MGSDKKQRQVARRQALRRREQELRRAGFQRIAGTDEVGAGPLAGPLVAAAVILPSRARLPGVDDSKRLTARERERWAEKIREQAVGWAVAEIGVERVDLVGPYKAALEGMTQAVLALDPPADYLLVDARPLHSIKIPQESVIGGDGRHLSIAAASVLAKVHRDGLMRRWCETYPGYGFSEHKGYGTPAHLEALERLGPCPLHRQTYAPVKASRGQQAPLF